MRDKQLRNVLLFAISPVQTEDETMGNWQFSNRIKVVPGFCLDSLIFLFCKLAQEYLTPAFWKLLLDLWGQESGGLARL